MNSGPLRIAVSGSGGFVGRHVSRHLAHAGFRCKALSRSDCEPQKIGSALAGATALINCAGEKTGVGKAAHEANVKLPRDLYLAARQAGVEHFIHVSSVAAIAETSAAGVEIDDRMAPLPTGVYGLSKLAGDVAIEKVASNELALTILRPPILIARDAGGVFAILRKAIMAGLPLPLAGLHNRRSFMHVDNFAAAIEAAVHARIEGAFITTDSAPITPTELCRVMAHAAGRSPHLFSPMSAGQALLKKALGRRGRSLFENAAFDGSRFSEVTGIKWPISPEHIIQEAMNRQDAPVERG